MNRCCSILSIWPSYQCVDSCSILLSPNAIACLSYDGTLTQSRVLACAHTHTITNVKMPFGKFESPNFPHMSHSTNSVNWREKIDYCPNINSCRITRYTLTLVLLLYWSYTNGNGNLENRRYCVTVTQIHTTPMTINAFFHILHYFLSRVFADENDNIDCCSVVATICSFQRHMEYMTPNMAKQKRKELSNFIHSYPSGHE